MKYLLLFGLVLFLTACGMAYESTPAPTPEAIKIIYPPALQAWADSLASCADKNPQVALYFIQPDSSHAGIQPNDIVLEFGNPVINSDVTYLFQVGWDQVVVVVNQENSVTQLSTDELKSIFSGQALLSKNASGQFTQVWVLPEDEPTRRIFDQAVMQEQSLTTEAFLAPDPVAMLQAIAQNIETIGYLPESFLTMNTSSTAGKVKIVQLDSALNADLRRPVVAITQSEPQGFLRDLLVCLEANSP
jgi:phosphate transport system substrate-binding protein